ncbi:diguanylate cyclase [Azoarcus sp. L1K30]|uniref:sensor domain-containing diguanylate cyclase n=1 Tax=Azoarcus sp. L1K30 TaxID=2820277 RepID=UPI001B84069C|nr:sensor domain-containing diguanylate cyclase [Azoarcus sp. L1K30]MBR0565953.1 diguanylate cyclase [Azoarcus sp. L1K30]
MHEQSAPTSGAASLRSRLTLWFGSLALFTLLSAGFYVGHIAIEKMTAAEGAAMHASAATVANALATGLREREDEIYLLSRSSRLASGNLDAVEVLQSLERRKEVHQEYAWIGVADTDGTIVQATGGMLVAQSVRERPWFKSALKERYAGDVHEAVLLAKLLPGHPSGEPLRFVDFAAPIVGANGQTVGVLGAHLHWSWVTGLVEDAVSGRRGLQQTDILIVDRTNHILYPERLTGESVPDTSPAQHLDYEVIHWPDGRDYLSSEVKINAKTHADLGWRLVARKPLDIATRPIRDLSGQLLLLGVLAALLFALLAYHLARRLSRPIEQLAQAARQVESRQAMPQFPTGRQVREIAQLSQSMQSMTRSLLAKEQELAAINSTLEATVIERTQALTEANAELARLAAQDGLTGLANRRRFDERLTDAFLACKRYGRDFSLLLLDVDHFKQVNDTHGHPVGDRVLKQVAKLIGESLRATDFVARYGGEEFVVLLPDTSDRTTSLGVAEKLRAAIAAAPVAEVGHITASIGLSITRAADQDPWQIVGRADAALYQAKAAGRNRVSMAPD